MSSVYHRVIYTKTQGNLRHFFTRWHCVTCIQQRQMPGVDLAVQTQCRLILEVHVLVNGELHLEILKAGNVNFSFRMFVDSNVDGILQERCHFHHGVIIGLVPRLHASGQKLSMSAIATDRRTIQTKHTGLLYTRGIDSLNMQ